MLLDLPSSFAILGLIAASTIFYKVAINLGKEKMTLDGFTLSDRSLEKKQFSNTFSASCFSLAMTLMYFFSNAETYGLFLLISPISYLAGQLFFLWMVKRSKIDLKDCRTISDLWYNLFPSKIIARLITVITCSSFLAILFIELLLGSIVFSLFLPQSIFFQTLSFFIMGILVLSYVRLGGYKAIVKTDKWQLTLMMSALIAIFVYSLLAPTTKPIQTLIYESLFNYTVGTKELIVYAIWLTLINFAMPFPQLSYWQRVAASANIQESWIGLVRSAWKVLCLFCLPIIAFIILHAKGYHYENFQAFLMSVKNMDSMTAMILFPIMIMGLCSAVFSSADVAVMAIIYALADKNTFFKKLNALPSKKFRKILTQITLFILILLSIIYWLQFSVLNQWIVPLIYSIVGQLVIVAPLPVYALIASRNLKIFPFKANTINTCILMIAIMSAWVALCFSVGLSKMLNNQYWPQIITLLGAGFILLSFFICQRSEKIEHEKLCPQS